MKTEVKTTLLATLLSVIFTTTLHAQGTAFTYQGRLNANGSPANGAYDFRFRLASDPLGNNYVGSAYLTNGIAVNNGLFTTTLDFGAGIFTGSNYWLEVDVRTNGGTTYTTLNPLQALTPTPYAITAGNVLSGGLPAAYSSAVTFDNAANSFNGSFTGDGGGLTNVNATTLSGASANSFWRTSGNSGTTSGANFLGTSDNQPLEFKVNGLRALRLEPTPNDALHASIVNVIAGSPANYVSNGVYGATIAGGGAVSYAGIASSNNVTADFGTVGGGKRNTAGGFAATVVGGDLNIASGDFGTVGGGWGNITRGIGAFVGGGGYNGTSYSGNTATGNASVIGGGEANGAYGDGAFVGGGSDNLATGTGSVIGGGLGNTASNYAATVGGGLYNTAAGGTDDTVGGGVQNIASGVAATVPGGGYNHAAGNYSFAAGYEAYATNNGAFVWADSQNAAFVSQADDTFNIRAQNGVHIQSNTGIHLDAADRPLIVRDWAPFDADAPAGKAGIGRWGLFMEPRYLTLGIPAVADRYFQVVKYNTDGSYTPLMSVDQGGNLRATGSVYANGVLLTSDRNTKENFTPLDVQTVLAKVAALPMTEWNYKTDSPAQKHLGPMAQDFHAAFGLDGKDDKHISVVDEGGVALAAIQGLNRKVDSENAALQTELKRQSAENAELKQEVEKLKKLVNLLNGKLRGDEK